MRKLNWSGPIQQAGTQLERVAASSQPLCSCAFDINWEAFGLVSAAHPSDDGRQAICNWPHRDNHQKMSKSSIDTIYVVASSYDARFARTCVASIRYFHPDVPITLVVGSPDIEPSLFEELRDYWNVTLTDVPRANWGIGYVKLEFLFRSPRERFLIIDSDVVFAGPVLDVLGNTTSDFVVDQRDVIGDGNDQASACRPPERLKTTGEVHELYYNWQKVAQIDPKARPPKFVFNAGQWIGTSGVLTREDFDPWIDWSEKPPKRKHPSALQYNDQGILNYVINQKAQLEDLSIEACDMMWWPPHGLEDFTVEKIAARQAPPMMLHWAGIKKPSFAAMHGPEILRFFEHYYYSKIPNGAWKRSKRRFKYAAEGWPTRVVNKTMRLLGLSVERLR